MKIPSWFLLGCGLLLLNALAVLGGVLTRHAVAELPIQESENGKSEANETAQADVTPEITAAKDRSITQSASGATIPPQQVLPEVPSLDELPPAVNTATPSILGVEDFKQIFSEQSTGIDIPVPLTEDPANSISGISDQLSQSYFEALQLRLKSATHLNQASQALVAEAKILFRAAVKLAKPKTCWAQQLNYVRRQRNCW